MTKNSTKNSKPLYKQWWFWLVIVIIIGAVGAGGASNNANNTPTTNNSSNSSESSTQQQPVISQDEPKIGDVVKADKLNVTANSIEFGYTPDSQYVHPNDGMEFVRVNLTLENISSDLQKYNALSFKIQDSNGNIETYTSAMMAQPDDAIHTGDLAAGGKKTGSIVFEIPQGDRNLKLHIYQNSYGSKILGTINLSD